MNKQFIDGVLEVLRDDERQICKQAAHIIAELAEEIDSVKASLDKNNRFIALMCQKCAYKQDDRQEEIDSLHSLNDFQQQQISCMQSDIDKMKCCGNCGNTEFDGGMGSCCKFDDLRCEGLSHWGIRR